MKQKGKIALSGAIYAILYSFFLYKNLSGITFPFFTAATIAFAFFVFKQLDIPVKKDSCFYVATTLLLSISQILTDNTFIHVMNIILVYALLICLFVHHFFDDSRWDFLTHISHLFAGLFGAIGQFFAPFKDWSAYRNEKREGKRNPTFPIKTILITIVAATPVLFIVTAMLADADEVFCNLVEDFFDIDIEFGEWFKATLLAIIVFLFMYGLISFLQKENKLTYAPQNRLNHVIAITAGIMFDTVYVVFSVIQILFLFMRNFKLPAGTTYAEYAREGFFQLLLVCIFNLAMVIIGTTKFEENHALKIILTIMSACTYVMVASSAFRMILYIRYYYFTFLRILVLWALFTIAVLMAGVVVTIWRTDFNLFKYSLVTATILYLILSFSHVDFFVAKWNLSETQSHSDFFIAENNFNDYEHLAELSFDAAPIILNDDNIGRYISTYFYTTAKDQKIGVRNFNISRFTAYKLANK